MAFSIWMPEVRLAGGSGGAPVFRFIPFRALLSKPAVKENALADRLIDGYMGGEPSVIKNWTRLPDEMEPKIENPSFINPKTKDGRHLDRFFDALVADSRKRVVRVAHYGDSQIEGDRVTAFVRRDLQKKFGGSGLGWVPFEDVASCSAYTRDSGPCWTKYSVFQNRLPDGFYGLSGLTFRCASGVGSLGMDLAKHVKYDGLTLYYGRAASEGRVTLRDRKNPDAFAETVLPAQPGFGTVPLALPGGRPTRFQLEFRDISNADFYALGVECDAGVQVDNFAIRGHSGAGLMRLDAEYLSKQIAGLNTRLVVLQYGANVVPYYTSDKQCESLEEEYFRLVKKFQNASPGLCVLVVGVGDMAAAREGEYVSYPNIPKVRDAQRRAAERAGCAFFDFYEVMGGEGSVLAWARRRLASFDGHLSPKGQEVVAKELVNALMREYQSYIFRRAKEKLSK